MKINYIQTAVVILLCTLFIYAGIFKAMDYQLFLSDLSKSPLLVKYDKTLLAPVVLGTEFLIVFLLAFNLTRKTGLFLSFFVMLLFTLYLSTLTHFFFYTNIPCSCGGILGKMSYPTHIIFNAAFTLMAATAILVSVKKPINLKKKKERPSDFSFFLFIKSNYNDFNQVMTSSRVLPVFCCNLP
ncbi:MauE/DoxX family redox-associated membrane protein [Pedobacter sp. NJ-S-72]